jgi:hypothetical protein
VGGFVFGLTMGLGTAFMEVGVGVSGLMAGTASGYAGGFTSVIVNTPGKTLAESVSWSNIKERAAEAHEFAKVNMLFGAIGGTVSSFAGGALAGSSLAPVTQQVVANLAGNFANQTAAAALSQYAVGDYSYDPKAMVVDALVATGVSRVPAAAKAAGKAWFPTSGAAQPVQRMVQAYARGRGLEIGIRATDPVSAAASRLRMAHEDIPFKPGWVKPKTSLGAVTVNGTKYRADLDIAFVRDRTGRTLSDPEVAAIRLDLNARYKSIYPSQQNADPFQHGAHLTMHTSLGGPKTTAQAAAIGDPGPATAFGRPGGPTALGSQAVRALTWGAYTRTTPAGTPDWSSTPSPFPRMTAPGVWTSPSAPWLRQPLSTFGAALGPMDPTLGGSITYAPYVPELPNAKGK